MISIQNNYNVAKENINFKSNLGMRFIRNTFFSNTEKISIDAFTRRMSNTEKNYIIMSQAHVAGIKPFRMMANLYSNIRARLV